MCVKAIDVASVSTIFNSFFNCFDGVVFFLLFDVINSSILSLFYQQR
jgi:hypothetical protein